MLVGEERENIGAVMSLPQTLYCGPSGWSYLDWNGVVYSKVPRNAHALEDVSRYFDAVEINTTFYQPIRPEIAQLWVRKVSANPKFIFTVKLGRRFTHERLLVAKEIGQFKDIAANHFAFEMVQSSFCLSASRRIVPGLQRDCP